MYDIEKVLTENPFVDELVYWTKILAMNAVIKNEQDALNNETVETVKKSDIYISCKEGTIRFELLTFTYDVLLASSLPDNLIYAALQTSEAIPEAYREEIRQLQMTKIINEYEEQNNYYRMLYGLPKIGEAGIKIDDTYLSDPDIVLDLTKYIHEMDSDEISILQTYGVMDRLIAEHPDKKYLRYVGDNKVDPYSARKAYNFQLLYVPTIESVEISDKFKDKYERNREYTMKTVYSDAFKYQSDYYDNFIMIFILLQTMIDVISEVQEFIARKEAIDSRCIKFIFASYGIPYYEEIPVKYQIAMMKNINTLLKYKSTTRNMVDICSLFGFPDIQIFKYYLLKDRNLDSNGNYIYTTKQETNENGELVTVEDIDTDFDLKFIKVPLDGKADEYIKSKENILEYDSITLGEETWDGDTTHELVKSEILKRDFTYIRSKYLSIDTVYEMSKLSFDMPYFYNMIYDNKYVEERLMLTVPYISGIKKFKLNDILSYLFALTAIYNNIEDRLMIEPAKVMYIKGFNFKADMQTLSNYVQEQGFTLEELGVADFQIPKSSILSYNQLIYIFTTNKNIYNHVVNQMVNANDKRIYDIYKHIYDALLINELSMDFFRLPDGNIATTFTQYIKSRDSVLYKSILQVRDIVDELARQKLINNIVSNTVYAMEEFLNSEDFRYIYAHLPAVSGEYIKKYMVKVINFFKSYKVHLLDISTVYKFDDKLDNTIRAIDKMNLTSTFEKDLLVKVIEDIKTNVNIEKHDRVAILEKVLLDISRWVTINESDKYTFSDAIADISISKEVYDKDTLKNIIDKAILEVQVAEKDNFLYDDGLEDIIINLNNKERLDMLEKIAIIPFYIN
jgi:hypothetical protein